MTSKPDIFTSSCAFLSQSSLPAFSSLSLVFHVFLSSGSSKSTFLCDSGTTGRRKCSRVVIRPSFQQQWGWYGIPLEHVQELEETLSPRQREVCADLSLSVWGWYWVFCRSGWSVQTDEFQKLWWVSILMLLGLLLKCCELYGGERACESISLWNSVRGCALVKILRA